MTEIMESRICVSGFPNIDRLCGDDGAIFTLQGIFYFIQRGDQYPAFRIGLQIGESGFDLWQHGAGLKLSLRAELLCLGCGQGVNSFLLRFSEILVDTGNACQNNQLVCLKLSRQPACDGVILDERGSAL